MKTKTRGNKRSKGGTRLLLLAVICTAVAFMTGLGTAAAATAEYEEYSDLAGKRISMLTGAPFEDLVRSKVPDVGAFSYYNSMPDMILALKNNKTDAILMNNAVADLALNRDRDLALFPRDLQDGVFGIAFARGDPRRDLWQDAYESIPEKTKQDLWEKWTGPDEAAKTVPEQDWPGRGGTVQAAVCDSLEPMSYVGKNGRSKGFDIEMILLIAKKLDMHVEFRSMEFSAVMASVESGKAAIGAGSIIVTDERREAADFVEYYPAAFELVVRSKQEESAGSGSVFRSIQESFRKTFIQEDRWKLFLSGIGTTLLITVFSILFGTVLGFIVFMICRKENRIALGITRFCIWLIQGMPVVVLLMILYYIVFAKAGISGTSVSIVGFTLIFAAAVYGMLKAGVSAVDAGQTEAAYALGYTDRSAFFRIVLPQAMPHFMPAYKGQITALIKATAVVGYVAVQDLTKMGDLIRSRTYEAFFPLIAVAVIYFILAAILTMIINKVELRTDPRRRSPEDILKGTEKK